MSIFKGEAFSFFSKFAGSPGYPVEDLESATFSRLELGASYSGLDLKGATDSADNYIKVPGKFSPAVKLAIYLRNANNNIVVIENGCQFYGTFKILGSNNIVYIGGENSQPSMLNLIMRGSDSVMFLGRGTTSNGATVTMHGDGKNVVIGEDCMFAKDIQIRNTDEHAAFDMETCEFLNPPEDVHIEPHVWLGAESWVTKGTKIGLGAITAAKCFVNRDIPRFSLAAGVPGKVKKSGVSWDRAAAPRAKTATHLKELDGALGAFESRLGSPSS